MDENKKDIELSPEEAAKKKIKNLISLSILLGGLFAGSLFVDVVQLVRGNGFSQRMLDKADVFNSNGKTWVAFEDPIVKVQVLTDDTCEACKPDEAIVGLRREIPTMLTEKVEINSDKGKEMQKNLGIKAIPAFVFSKDIESTTLFEQAQTVFDKKNDSYVLNSVAVGLPIGKYTESPTISENDAMVGNKDAKVKIVEFSDFQCPYCKQMHETVIKSMLKEYGDKISFVFKHMPLSFHPQAENAALAGACSNEQGKFIQYADKLFATQAVWGKTTGTQSFKNYAVQLGLNSKQFNECLDSGKYKDQIKADTEQAKSFGISGTPATFINDQVQNGLVKYDAFKTVIDQELAK